MDEKAQLLIDYIRRDIMKEPNADINEDTPLVSSGRIDSLALVDILQQVQDVTRMKISAGKVQAKDMDTVRMMLATAQRVGKPKQ
jgi:acyl carrier protein